MPAGQGDRRNGSDGTSRQAGRIPSGLGRTRVPREAGTAFYLNCANDQIMGLKNR